MTSRFIVALAVLALPLAAHGQTRTEAALAQYRAEAAVSPPAPLQAASAKAPSDIADPRLFLARSDDAPARPKGTVQTAVDLRFNPKAVGSLGYLCGLQPGPNDRGGVRSSSDPAGTFLGGQFKVAF